MLCKKRPLKVTRTPTVRQKFSKCRQRTCQIDHTGSGVSSGVEVPADHDLLTWLVPYAASMHRRFSVGREGKTAYERNVGRQFGERIWWMPLQPSNRRLGLLDSRFEQGRYLGPMDGSSTVLVGTASGVVKARTSKRLPLGERLNGSLLDEAHGSELAPNDGGRVGDPTSHVATTRGSPSTSIGAPISTSLATQTTALGVPTQRARREQEVDHSERCRSRSWRQSW